MRSADDSGSSNSAPLTVQQEVRQVYEDYAAIYAQSTLDYSRFPGLMEELEAFERHAPCGLVLDLGSGSGRDVIYLERLGRRTISADVSLPLLDLLPADLAGSRVCCEAESLPFQDETFAGVLGSGVLLHLPRLVCETALLEIRRVLCIGGVAFVSMKRGSGEGWQVTGNIPRRRWFCYYDPGAFGDLCSTVGLVVMDLQVGPREDWFSVMAGRVV